VGDLVPKVSIPLKLIQFTSFTIKRIDCGDEMTAFLTSNGDVYTAGWGEEERIPTKISTETLFGVDSKEVQSISVGNSKILL